MIKYLGSKRILVPLISSVASYLGSESICDLFAGTTRVGQGFRERGLVVHSNDLASYSEILGLAYIVAGSDNVDRKRVRSLLAELNKLEGTPGYFTRTFCEESRYFQPKNGARVDAIRNRIDELDLTSIERGLLLTSLMEAADRVDSTVGVQMAYLKSWAKRAHNDLELRMPKQVDGPVGSVSRLDANTLAKTLETDCVYLDPPYNQHSYFGNYHIWETLVRWDEPETYGIAKKRLDTRDPANKSDYNSKRKAWATFAQLLADLPTKSVIVSFSNEGYHDRKQIFDALTEKRHTAILAADHPRYVGAQIGIHNPQGEKVGEVSHLKNREYLFVADRDLEAVRRVCDEVGQHFTGVDVELRP